MCDWEQLTGHAEGSTWLRRRTITRLALRWLQDKPQWPGDRLFLLDPLYSHTFSVPIQGALLALLWLDEEGLLGSCYLSFLIFLGLLGGWVVSVGIHPFVSHLFLL